MSEKEYPKEVQVHLNYEKERGHEIVSVECCIGKDIGCKLYRTITKYQLLFWVSTFLYMDDIYSSRDTVMITPEVLRVLNSEAEKGQEVGE